MFIACYGMSHRMKWGNLVLVLQQVFLVRFMLIGIVAYSLGMGVGAPWGRSISIAYARKTKGILNVKENLR